MSQNLFLTKQMKRAKPVPLDMALTLSLNLRSISYIDNITYVRIKCQSKPEINTTFVNKNVESQMGHVYIKFRYKLEVLDVADHKSGVNVEKLKEAVFQTDLALTHRTSEEELV